MVVSRMFIGHYSASLLARSARPEVPLWVWVGAAQFLDILWSIFMMTGFERAEADPAVTEGLAFIYYPYSHSLAASALWALLVGLAASALRVSWGSAFLLGAVVFSHWPLDLLVHRADLPLWPNSGAMLGLGMWNYPSIELALEIILFAAAGLVAWRHYVRSLHRSWPLLAFLAFGILFCVAMRQLPPPTEVEPVKLGATALVLYVGFVLLAWLVERCAKPRDEGRARG
jgi:membrane-bound metal-dependent hydrolase YbcI (DUF457 family)